jgi:hypothetical protein
LLVIALSLYTGRTGHQMGGDVRHVERDAATVRRSHLGPVRKARWWEPEAVAAAGFVVRMPSLERWVHGHVLAGRSPPCRGCGRRRR